MLTVKSKKQRNLLARCFVVLVFMLASLDSSASKVPVPDKSEGDSDSPWLITPLISSAPKFGSSIGAMVGYLYSIDEESPTSMLSVMGSYSNTDSLFYGAFTRMYFDEDKQRLIAGAVRGEINNEYADFIGIGVPVNTEDDIHALFLRYTYRVKGDWFIGP